MTAPLKWQKSSYSQPGGECVEPSASPSGVHLRESDAPRTVIRSDRAALGALLTHLKGQRTAQTHPLE